MNMINYSWDGTKVCYVCQTFVACGKVVVSEWLYNTEGEVSEKGLSAPLS
jgi:hypothetical protein